MNFFGILFYLMIIVFFIKAKKTAESGKSASHEKKHKGSYSGQTQVPNVPKSGKISTPNVSGGKRTEKAFAEPHREEQYQPKIRTNNLWGEDEHAHRRIVALRLMEGDPVPEGYVKIKCPYCGADNLVTKHCKQYHSCYFCRVPID